MIIARMGKYYLSTNVYICDHKYMTHDISISKEITPYEGKPYSIVIARIDPSESNLVSVGLRLVEEIDSYEDIEAVRQLAKIAYEIAQTDACESGYEYEPKFTIEKIG